MGRGGFLACSGDAFGSVSGVRASNTIRAETVAATLACAKLGAIGFEGRWDYACIGSVTNLAARLCGDAKGGQILTNQKTLARIDAINPHLNAFNTIVADRAMALAEEAAKAMKITAQDRLRFGVIDQILGVGVELDSLRGG